MKFVNEFDEFIKNNINKNRSKLDLLNKRSDTIIDILKGGGLGYCSKNLQGSVNQKTSIQPTKEDTLDADLVVYIKTYDSKIIHKAGDLLKYRGYTVKKYNNCVTVAYANFSQIDVVFMLNGTNNMITTDDYSNEKKNYFKEFRDWILKQNTLSKTNNLRKVIKLAKYIRREKSFKFPSTLLTALLGVHVSEGYGDLPTAFYHIFDSLNAYLQDHDKKPSFSNPVDSNENLFDSISDDQYCVLRKQINTIFKNFSQGYNSYGNVETINLYSKVFGEKFRKVCSSKDNFVRSNISKLIRSFPHMKDIPKNTFEEEMNIQKSFRVDVTMFSKNNSNMGRYNGHVRKGISLKFVAPVIDNDRYYQWRVTNTGIQAKKKLSLRGDIVNNTTNEHTEPTAYIGNHFVECFLMSNTGKILAKSERLQVYIVG